MTEKLRIALAMEYPVALRGGVSVLIESLAQDLSQEHEIFLVSCDNSIEKIPSATASSLFGHFFWSPSGRVGSGKFSQQVRELISWLQENKIDILHLHCGGVYGWGNRFPWFSVARAANRVGIKVCWTDHLVVSPTSGICGNNKPLWFKYLLLPWAWLGKIDQLNHVCCEIAVSTHDHLKLKKWYFPMRRKFRRIYHSRLAGIAEKPFITATRQQTILNVGHVAFRKGQHVLAQAFVNLAARFPDWKLLFVGHDSGDGCWQEIESIRNAHHLSDRIILLGQQQDVTPLMTTCGLYVQPSRWEALGLALQEALYYGCPAIGTNVGGIPELIDDGANGFLVPPDDPTTLGERMAILMGDDGLKTLFSRNARSSIFDKSMSRQAMVSEHADLYRHLHFHSNSDAPHS